MAWEPFTFISSPGLNRRSSKECLLKDFPHGSFKSLSTYLSKNTQLKLLIPIWHGSLIKFVLAVNRFLDKLTGKYILILWILFFLLSSIIILEIYAYVNIHLYKLHLTFEQLLEKMMIYTIISLRPFHEKINFWKQDWYLCSF